MEKKKRWMGVLLIFVLFFSSFGGILPAGGVMEAYGMERLENDFYYIIENGEATITGYIGSSSNLTIPSQLGGAPVTVIGEGAFIFYGHDIYPRGLNITLPNTVKRIEEVAFFSAGITEIKFSNQLQYIGESAFLDNQIEHLQLPKTLEIINASAFVANKLKSVTIPENVTGIGGGAFMENEIETVKFPESLEIIGRFAFSNNVITEVVLPKGVKELYKNAFSNNPLSKVVIHNSETFIEENPFYEDIYMELPGEITFFGHDPSTAKDLANAYESYTFYPISALEKIHEYRIAVPGGNRYSTAEAIINEVYGQAETVIIVRGDGPGSAPNVVDALSASGLAGAHSAPILLTHQSRLSDDTKNALKNLGAKEAIIVGGDQAVSPSVEAGIKALGMTTRRIEGVDRFSTAAEVAIEVVAENSVDTAIIAGGHALVDSLVAGPVAHEMGYPILLVGRSVPEATEQMIIEQGIKNLIIIGGTGVVSQSVENQLNQLVSGEVQRVAGQNRFETSIAIAKEYFPAHTEAVLVNGMSFVDAVPASILGDPILYVRENRIPESILNLLSEISGYRAVGGPAVITDMVLLEAYMSLK